MASFVKRWDDEKFGSIAVWNINHSAMAMTVNNNMEIMCAPMNSDIDESGNLVKVTEKIAD